MLKKNTLVELIHFANQRFFDGIPTVFIKPYMKILDKGRTYIYLNKHKFSEFTIVFVHRILQIKFQKNDFNDFDIKDTLNRYEAFYKRILKKQKDSSSRAHFTPSCSYMFIYLFMETEKIDI